MLTAQDIYAAARALSLPERLRLAALLLDELDKPAPDLNLADLAGYSDAWTEEDIQDLRQFSARHLGSIDASLDEQDAALPPSGELHKMKMEQTREPERT